MTLFIIVAALVVALLAWIGYGLFGRRTTVNPTEIPLDAGYKALLSQQIDFYQRLGNNDKMRFEGMVAAFIQNIRIEGVGLDVTDLDRILVAASAVIPIFGYKEWRYNNLTNVILYPDTFNNNFEFEGADRNITGMVGSGYMNGQMLLSRSALLRGFSASSGAHNTGIHEFVHLLDKADGTTDGLPQSLIAHEYAAPWLKMMHQEMNRIEKGHSDIDPYAATSEAEFLAVASEYFFEKPGKLQDKHPELYRQLSRLFAQNPAGTGS